MDSVVAKLGLALAIGLVVGLERGWRQREEPEGSRVAGLRTYGLAGLLGGISAALTDALGTPIVLAVAFVVFAAIFAWFQERMTSRLNPAARLTRTRILFGRRWFPSSMPTTMSCCSDSSTRASTK